MEAARETAPSAVMLQFVAGGDARVEATEEELLADLPVTVSRLTRYRAGAGNDPIGSAPITASEVLVLEFPEHPPDSSSVATSGVAIAAQPASEQALSTAGEHTAVLVVLARNTDAEREDEFVRWYDEVHIPEVIGTGTHNAGTRLVLDEASAAATGAPHLTLWTTDWDDPALALSTLFAQNPRMTMWDEVDGVHIGWYRLVGRAERPLPRRDD